MKKLLYYSLALVLWTGIGVEPSGDDGYAVGFQSALAAKGDNDGGKGGGNAGGGDRGKSGDRGSKGKGDKPTERQAKKNLRAELRGLNSLGRNINGLINSNDDKLAEFRSIFVNEDGTRKERVELPDDETLAAMVGNLLGAEPSEDAVVDARARLEILAEQYAALPEKSDDENDDADDQYEDEEDGDEDGDDDEDDKRKGKSKGRS